MFTKLFARHLRQPSGLVGRYVARWMNQANGDINSTALHLAMAQGGARLLEVGFGGGSLLQMALELPTLASVTGLDASPDMVKRARRKLRGPLQEGRLQLHQGLITELPFGPAHFDAVVSVNTLNFWPSLEAPLRECRRVLAPGGRLVLGFDDKEDMCQWSGHHHGFTLYEVAEVHRALESCGFRCLETLTLQAQGSERVHCVQACSRA
nr:class I SAM-dependent methyltransferase [uncultured Holophaga sp.]